MRASPQPMNIEDLATGESQAVNIASIVTGTAEQEVRFHTRADTVLSGFSEESDYVQPHLPTAAASASGGSTFTHPLSNLSPRESQFSLSPEKTERLQKLLKLEHENDALILLRVLWNDSWPMGVSLLILILFQVFLYGLTKISSPIEEAFRVNKDMFAVLDIRFATFDDDDDDDCFSLACAMSHHDFRLLQVVIISFVSILSGLASELFFGTQLLTGKNRSRIEWSWIYANLLFPLFILISVTIRNAFGIVLGIIGMYKFGFPETFAYVTYAFTHSWCEPSTWSYILNGLGHLFHHSASIFYIVAMNLNLWYPNNHVLAIPFPLCLMHATQILSYAAPTLYPFVQASLEIWFEIEAFAIFSKITEVTQPYVTSTMLVAHWFYWIAALLAIIFPVEPHAGRSESMGGDMIAPLNSVIDNYVTDMKSVEATIRHLTQTLRTNQTYKSRNSGSHLETPRDF